MGVKKNITREWFDRWSNEYDRTLGSISFHRGLVDLVVKNAKVKCCDRVLDIGCGTGLLSLKILQRADCSILGIDNSSEMLKIFKEKIKKLRLKEKVSLRLMDAGALNFKEGSFDKAVSSVVLHHLKDKRGMIKGVYRALKPGGTFIIGEMDMDSTGSHKDAARLRRIMRVLEQEWIPALRDVSVEAFEKMYDNGKKHILNRGEYSISLRQWAGLLRKAGFRVTAIKRVPHYDAFGIVIAKKPIL